MIGMGRLIQKLNPKEDITIQWYTQEVSITTNIKVKIDFTSPKLKAIKIMTWNCNVDDSTKGIYDTILGRYLLIDLGLNLKWSDHVIESDDGTFKGYMAPMVDLGTYEFKYINTVNIKPEESFTNDYSEEIHKSEKVCNSTKTLHVILDAEYEKEDLHKVMENQCQHMTEVQRNKLLKKLKTF